MNNIYITGDIHGDRELMREIITNSALNSGDTLIICGNFGFLFWDSPDENDYLDRLERLSITFCFTDGNHENFSAINAYPIEKWNGGKVHRIRRNIFHLMRGQIFDIEERPSSPSAALTASTAGAGKRDIPTGMRSFRTTKNTMKRPVTLRRTA